LAFPYLFKQLIPPKEMVWVSYRVELIGFKPLPKPVNMILAEIPYLYINNKII